MHLYHFTRWPTLTQLVGGKLIAPAPFSNEDRKHVVLDRLAQLGLDCVWFTTQVWSSNRFGSYGLKYQSSDIAMTVLLDLGKHNGARCFLSTPPLQATWLAAHLQVRHLPPNDASFAQVSKEDRIDVLATWAVPLSHEIEFVTGSGLSFEDQANFSRARLLALAIVTRDQRFDTSLTGSGLAEAANNLWRTLTGNHSSFGTGAVVLPASARSALTIQALTDLAAGNKAAARATVQQLGDVTSVADALALVLSDHFGCLLSSVEITSVR